VAGREDREIAENSLSRVFWLGQEKTEREVEKRLKKAITGQALEGSRNRPIRGCIRAWKE